MMTMKLLYYDDGTSMLIILLPWQPNSNIIIIIYTSSKIQLYIYVCVCVYVHVSILFFILIVTPHDYEPPGFQVYIVSTIDLHVRINILI